MVEPDSEVDRFLMASLCGGKVGKLPILCAQFLFAPE